MSSLETAPHIPEHDVKAPTDDSPLTSWLSSPARLFGALFIWLYALAWLRPLNNPDESRYLDIPRWMVESGDWLVPRINGLPFLHKPPLFFWLEATFIKIFGVSVWVGRLTPVLATLVLIGSVYTLVRALDGQRAATWSALLLGTTPLVYGAGQYLNLDMLVAATITLTLSLALLAMLEDANAKRRQRLLYAAYAAAGISFLSKGLIGFLLPGAIFVVYALVIRRPDWLLKALSPVGAVIFLAISLPWLILVERRVPGAIHHFIVFHHFQRYATTSFNNQWGPWFYPAIILITTLPWSIPLAQTVIADIKAKAWAQRFARPSMLLGIVWFLIVVVFFSVPRSKLVGYILPCIPGFALILAPIVAQRVDRLHILTIAAIACATSIAVFAAAQSRGPVAVTKALAKDIKPGDELVFTERYHFDAAIQLNRPRPAYVWGDWSKSSSELPDTVRRQLTEGREFDPAAAFVLVDDEKLRQLLIGPARVFILTTVERQKSLPVLQSLRIAVPPNKRGFQVLVNR